MARSYQGGTRGFIRGKVANDLYQVTRDVDGKRIQLVRSVEDSRKNPNTQPQAIARMQMALCMGALSQFKDIVDHSFQGIPYGQLSIAHFVQVNIPLIQADTRNNFDGESRFSYPTKGVAGVRCGEFIMSEGSLTIPNAVSLSFDNDVDFHPTMVIQLPWNGMTFGQFKSMLGANAGDFMTLLGIANRVGWNSYDLYYTRFYLTDDIPDNQGISNARVKNWFTTDGNSSFTIVYNSSKHTITMTLLGNLLRPEETFVCNNLIFSKWDGKVWQRNSSRFRYCSEESFEVAEVANPDAVFESWYPEWDGNNPF